MLLLHKAFLNHSFRRGLIVCRPFFGRRLATAPDVPGVKETALESLTIPYATLSELGEELRWPFEDSKTLATALVHRSVINSGIEHKVFAEVRPGVITRLDDNNEKLELLGDKVFGLLACNHVFHNYNSLSEGQMSQSVHSIVSRRSADYFCRKLHLNRFMVIAFHVQKSSGRGATQRGDFFEALLGAVYQDGGYSAAETFFNDRVVNLFQPHHIDKRIVVDNDQKRSLQELLVKSGLPANKLGSVLTYVPVSSTQGDGRQSYTQAIHLFGQRLSIGRGPTKIGAGQNAAQKLLSIFKKNDSATCVIIRLAKAASDEETVEKAERVRQTFCTTSDVPSTV